MGVPPLTADRLALAPLRVAPGLLQEPVQPDQPLAFQLPKDITGQAATHCRPVAPGLQAASSAASSAPSSATSSSTPLLLQPQPLLLPPPPPPLSVAPQPGRGSSGRSNSGEPRRKVPLLGLRGRNSVITDSQPAWGMKPMNCRQNAHSRMTRRATAGLVALQMLLLITMVMLLLPLPRVSDRNPQRQRHDLLCTYIRRQIKFSLRESPVRTDSPPSFLPKLRTPLDTARGTVCSLPGYLADEAPAVRDTSVRQGGRTIFKAWPYKEQQRAPYTLTEGEHFSDSAEASSPGESEPTRCTIYRRRLRAQRDRKVLAERAAAVGTVVQPGEPCRACGMPRVLESGHAYYRGQFFCEVEQGPGKTCAQWVEEQRPREVPLPRTTAWRMRKGMEEEGPPGGKKPRKLHKLRVCQRCGQPVQADFGHSQYVAGGSREAFCAMYEGKTVEVWLAERRAGRRKDGPSPDSARRQD
ncbi:unnamed protein product [Xyrichtys novacula]|uniref:Unnamed protein product n=1 Tax=Xyrichtys novacula TaxID=13765 RepID=A0AAV1EIP1_XYRNO|nr:unnamed protein product [Xyrichtys novacula]